MMGIFDRLRGARAPQPWGRQQQAAEPSADEQAIARYRYMLRTAPPETIEQAHAEAFAKLTPEQRRMLLAQLAADMPAAERTAAERAGDEPGALARAATRAEIRQPGTIERALGTGAGASARLGGSLAGTLLASLAGTVLGTMIGQHFLASHAQAFDAPGHGFSGDDAQTSGDDLAGDADDASDDPGLDFDPGSDFFDV